MPTLAKLATVVVLALLAAFASTQAFVPSANAAFTDTDADGAIDLAEEVFGSNPNGADSTPESTGFPYLFDTNVCVDGMDNDLDGTTDSTDPGCTDTDEDLFADEVEEQLGGPADDADYYPETSALDNALISLGVPIQFCANGEDDDDDGLEDAAYPGCTDLDSDNDDFADLVEKNVGSNPSSAASVPEHETFNAGSCSDGSDNDLDSDVDAADEGCAALTNDDLANALSFDFVPFAHTAKVLNATVQPSERESDCVLEEQANTVWYQYTSGQDRTVVLDTTGSDFTTVVTVWRQGTFGLSQVSCVNGFGFYTFDPQARLAFKAEAGQTYYIQIGAESAFYLGAGRLVFNATAGSPPANDAFAAATAVMQLPYTTSVDTVAATVEVLEPASSCLGNGDAAPQNTVWYKYTPAIDTYVNADTGGTDFIGATVAVYTRGSSNELRQEACGYVVSPFLSSEDGSRLAFFVEAGRTYFIQAGGSYRTFGQSGRAEEGGAVGGFSLGSPGGHLTLNLQALTLPSCPAPQYNYQDPIGDTAFGDLPAWDIERLAATVSGSQFCLAIDLRDPVDPESILASLSFDTDNDRDTGYDDVQYDCGNPTGLGTDTDARYQPESGLLILVVNSSSEGGPYSIEYGIGRLEGGVLHIALPLEAIGDDPSFRFVASVSAVNSYTPDCAPNGGNIVCDGGPCAFVPFRNGDANCVPGANAIDAAIVLQHSAGLLPTLPCPDAADVDGNTTIDSRDAALILQYTAGLLPQLPPSFF